MSETPPKRAPVRWLTLAEIVGLVALVIAALGYWDSHRQTNAGERARAEAAAERRAEQKAEALKRTFVMTGTPGRDGGRIVLATLHPEQVIQTQTIWFPADIRADPVETTGNPRLDAAWIKDGLRRTGAKGGRVPVGVLTVYIEDGQSKTDRAVYQLGYSVQSRLLRGDRVTLEGLSLARRNVDGDLQKAAGALWAAR